MRDGKSKAWVQHNSKRSAKDIADLSQIRSAAIMILCEYYIYFLGAYGLFTSWFYSTQDCMIGQVII